MNSILKKMSATAVASAVVVSSCISLCSGAGLSLPECISSKPISRLFRSSSNIPFSCDIPQFVKAGESGESIIPVVPYAPVTETVDVYAADNDLPSSFDLRTVGKIGSVKNQGAYGTCWAHSSAASAESSIIDAVPDIDLSELHTAYMSYFGADQIYTGITDTKELLNYGGSSYVAVNLWSQWYGPVLEKRLPYENTGFFDDLAAVDTIRSQSDYHLENAYMFEYEPDKSNFSELNSIIKQIIYNGNAVDVSFYNDYEKNYSFENFSSYTNRKRRFANHAVTIAGWDDSFPASDFVTAPPGDGAWLIKNSWGLNSGDNGYIWISYYDNSLCNFAAYELGDKSNYKYNLQHDSFVPLQTLSAYEESDEILPSYMANIFDVETDMQLEAVSTYFMNPGTEYEVTVYTDLTDPADPSSGTPSVVTKGRSELTGYITVELDEDVYAAAGSKAGVVVKMYCPDNPYVIPLETCVTAVDESSDKIVDISSYTTHDAIEAFTQENQSFFSADGINWSDITEADFVYDEESEEKILEQIRDELYDDLLPEETKLIEAADALYKYYTELFSRSELHVLMGNISLKAFGNPVNTVDFSHISGQVASDEAVELSVKDGDMIYVSINGGAYEPYTSPIKIEEKTTVSATTDHMNISQRTYTPEKAQFNELGCNAKTGSGTSAYYTAERISESEYIIHMGLYQKYIEIYPVTSADIILNGEAVESGKFGNRIEIPYGETVLTYKLNEVGKLENEVRLRIERSPVTIDLEKETVTYPSEFVFIDNDGNIIKNGSYIGDHAGQTLNIYMNGEPMPIEIPPRAAVPELEIDYRTETLGFIPNDIAELLVFSTKDDPADDDYISALPRLIDGTWINSGMVMNKAIGIIPGEILTFRLRAGNGCFAGEPVTYVIPEAGEAPADLPDFTTDENGFIHFDDHTYEIALRSETGTEKLDEYAEYSGYSDVFAFIEIMKKRMGFTTDTELVKYIASWWGTENTPLNSDEFAIRYAATDTEFASKVKIIRLGILGDVDGSGKIEAYDASMVLMHYACLSAGREGVIAEERLDSADCDRDGKITAADAGHILELYSKLAAQSTSM